MPKAEIEFSISSPYRVAQPDVPRDFVPDAIPMAGTIAVETERLLLSREGRSLPIGTVAERSHQSFGIGNNKSGSQTSDNEGPLCRPLSLLAIQYATGIFGCNPANNVDNRALGLRPNSQWRPFPRLRVRTPNL